MVPVREYISVMKKQGRLGKGVDAKQVRGVRTGDFFGGAGAMSASFAEFEKPNDVRERERMGDVDEVEVVSDDDDEAYETTSDDSDRGVQEKRRKASRRERV